MPRAREISLDVARAKKLHRTGQALLYDIAKRCRAGYVWWLVQDVPASKVLRTVAVLSDKYATERTSVARSEAKRRGEEAAVLFVWAARNDPAGYTTMFRVLLLATEHLDGEVMFDGRHKPLKVNLYANKNAVFRLKATPIVDGKDKKKESTKAKKRIRKYDWDWALTAKSVATMRERFASQSSNPAGLQKLRAAYLALPMVRGYRQQLKEVITDTRVQWKKATTPAAREYKKGIKAGTKSDPLSLKGIPFIRGFPRLYDDPPMMLGAYLDANTKLKRKIEKEQLKSVAADHAGGTI